MLEKGYKVAAIIRPQEKEAFLERCIEGDNLKLLEVLDLEDLLEPLRLAKETLSRFGHINCLIMPAALLKRAAIENVTREELQLIFSVNFNYVFNMCQDAIPSLENGGSIVNLASLSAHTGRAYSSHYAANKGAGVALTKSLAQECVPKIHVNCV